MNRIIRLLPPWVHERLGHRARIIRHAHVAGPTELRLWQCSCDKLWVTDEIGLEVK